MWDILIPTKVSFHSRFLSVLLITFVMCTTKSVFFFFSKTVASHYYVSYDLELYECGKKTLNNLTSHNRLLLRFSIVKTNL
ncbi:unnamed protein product, partial [Arabidopsis halleri]